MNEYWYLVTWCLVVLITTVSGLAALVCLFSGAGDEDPKAILVGLACTVVVILSGCWLYVYG